ncbi:hypothetical protein QR680_009464 [Steinernema hermaphroditum]|uniref:Protein kinase domain-containing protein n=1 Tax=Steinernema hermaphroditum TaxID=289476 RepID=A0AA39IME9_9BILA|nr:hypothetical protein QR680_009464 [Steinernema hermaphroditum]
MRCRYCKVRLFRDPATVPLQVNVHRHCSTYLAASCRDEEKVIVPRYAKAPSLDLPMAERAEGWIVYFLFSDPSVNTGSSTTAPSTYAPSVTNPLNSAKRLFLSEIVSVSLYKKSAINKKSAPLRRPRRRSSRFAPHLFEIRTLSNVTYCVGEQLDASRGLLAVSNGPEKLRSPLPAATPEVFQKYDLQKARFGCGLFGHVYDCVERRSHAPVALKVIPKEHFLGDDLQNLRFELERVRRLVHPCILRLEDVLECTVRLFLVSKALHSNLSDMILSHRVFDDLQSPQRHLQRLTDRVTRFLTVQILSELRYIHSKGLVHSNLKPENVLVADERPSSFPHVRLSDIGFARFIQDPRYVESVVGTEAYLAPEIVQRTGFDHTSDLYSVGIIVYVALSGKVPSLLGEHSDSEAVQIPLKARDLIKRLLELRIEDRVVDVDECFEHAWFDSVETYMDLRNLEMKTSAEERFSTTTHDDLRFESRLRKLNLTDSFM